MRWTSLWRVRAGPSWALRSRLERQLTRATSADCGNCRKPLGVTSSWAWSCTTLRTPSHSAITCSLRQSLVCGDKQANNTELIWQLNIFAMKNSHFRVVHTHATAGRSDCGIVLAACTNLWAIHA